MNVSKRGKTLSSMIFIYNRTSKNTKLAWKIAKKLRKKDLHVTLIKQECPFLKVS